MSILSHMHDVSRLYNFHSDARFPICNISFANFIVGGISNLSLHVQFPEPFAMYHFFVHLKLFYAVQLPGSSIPV